MPKRIHLYDYLAKEIESMEDSFEEFHSTNADTFTESNMGELVADMYDGLDRLAILTEGTDWEGIRKVAVNVGLKSLLIARYARVTDEELKKSKKESKK